jgi:hypothetical protein
LLGEQLKDSSSRDKKTRSRQRARRISRTASKERIARKSNSFTKKDPNQLPTSSRRRAPAQDTVVKRFVSSISFTDDSDDDKNECDCSSAVSSLDMSFPNESSDEEDLSPEDGEHADTCCSSEMDPTEEDSSIFRLKSQIKMLRKCSMERFQATAHRCSSKMPCKVDTSPSLPSSLSVRRDSLQDFSLATSNLDDQTLHESTPYTNAVLMKSPNDHEPPKPVLRKLSKQMESDPSLSNGSSSSAGHVLTPLSTRRRTFPTCTDRWCGSAASMIRDTELVRQSFERATSLRKKHNDKENNGVLVKVSPSQLCRNNNLDGLPSAATKT